MTVLLLVPQYPPESGGVARSAARLADGLVDAGERVVVATTRSDSGQSSASAVVRDSRRTGLVVLRFPSNAFQPSHWARELDELFAQLAGSAPKVVHAMGSLRFGQIALAVGGRFRAPVVYSMCGSDVNIAALHHPGRFASVVRGASALTAVSRTLAERAQHRSALPRAVTIIPNAVHPAASLPRERCLELGVPAGTRLVGARLSRRWTKGPERLLEIIRCLSRCDLQPLGLCVFGAGDDGALAAAWRDGGSVGARPYVYLGEVEPDRMRDVLGGLDLLLMSSHYEGMPNLLLEALSVGTPVAATPAGGCHDALQGSGAGLLLPWDEAAAARAIAALLASDGLGQMRARARAHVAASYTPERELAAIQALYRSLVAVRAVASG